MRRLTLEASRTDELEARPRKATRTATSEPARFIVATNAVLLKRVESELPETLPASRHFAGTNVRIDGG
jgi:hypothetical protein